MKPSRILTAAAFAAFCLFVHAAPASAQLTPEMRADMMVGQLADALKSGDNRKIIDLIAEMRKILPELPPDLVFQEAEARLATGDLLAGKKALDEYLHRTGRAGKFYDKSLNHYIALKEKVAQQIMSVRADINSRMAAKGANLMGVFEMFVPGRLRQRQGEQLLSVKYDRVGDLIRDWRGDACEVRIFDYVTIDAKTRTFTPDGRPVTREGFSSFHWLNNNGIRLDEIRGIRQIDTFESKSPANRNFLMVNVGPDKIFKMKFKMDNHRFIDSMTGERTFENKELTIVLPNPGMGQYLTKQLLYLRDLCQITKE